MATSDIDRSLPPTEKRCTADLFRPDRLYSFGKGTLPSGSPLRKPDTPASEWPPPILLDAVYAGAVLHNFGTQTLKDEIAATWKDTFDSGGDSMPSADADLQERSAAEKLNEAQKRARERGPDYMDMLMAMPYIMDYIRKKSPAKKKVSGVAGSAGVNRPYSFIHRKRCNQFSIQCGRILFQENSRRSR